MKDSPLVSVIIPTYQNSNTLSRAVNSALKQTYQNIEVIVVDDNPPDTKERKLTECVMRDYDTNPKVVYIKHERNRNGSAARNTGFAHSNGEYIELLDDDDYFVPEKTDLQVEFLENHREFDGVYGGRFERGEAIVYDKEGDLSKELLSYEILPCTCTLMLRRRAYQKLGGFDENYERHQDFEFLLRFFQKFKMGVIKQPLFYHCERVGADNRLRLKYLEEQKINFLKQFDPIIKRLDTFHPGCRAKIYSLHYARIFWNYMRHLKLFDALRVFFNNLFQFGGVFLGEVGRYAVKYFKN